jgi:hypothetical protein
MALAAAQVVDAVAALLVPMVATGGRVYTSRAWPLAESDLPAWRVTAEDETVETDALDDSEQTHSLNIQAQCSTRAVADLDDALHALAASGLGLLFDPPAPYGLRLQSIDRTLATEGEAAVGRVTLSLNATFQTAPSAPETIL